jgi:DNA polymerase-1
VYEDLEPEAKKKWRVGAKRTNFGIIYGAQAPTIKATLKKDGVFITDEESEMMVNAFLEARPGLVAGMKAMEDFLAEHGYVESPTGYRRRIPEVFSENRTLRERALRQGVNFGVQNAAAQMTLMALCIIHSRMEAQNYQSKLILNVHDSLVFDCHVNEFQEIATASKYIMENLPEYSDEVFPGMDWSWLDVPIVAECELGINYGKPAGFDPTKLDGPTEADGPLFGEKKGQTVLLRDARSIDELWEAMAYKVAH